MGLKEIFEKQGGMTLIKRYWKSGALFTAVGQFLLLGKSRTALEILRLSTQLKAKQKLEKKYKKKLEEFDQQYDVNLPHEKSNKVWVCWFQGMEDAPEIVRRCYRSLQENLTERDIVLITTKNMMEYVQFPDYIQDKINAGIIKGAHLSDLLRLELLCRYGGTWVDATVFCSSDNIPKYMLESDLFVFQNLKPGRDGHCINISNWFITATSNNRILGAMKFLLYKYWQCNNAVLDYYIFHEFFRIVTEFYSEEWKKVIPFSNATPHILLLRLFDDYDHRTWCAIKEQCCFHKLTYKFENREFETSTYYSELILEKNK